ncbi:hypothetical protein SSX86_014960 [Deinandra increscens subsp. villosa]|uniref:Uncharacterized protein n=1 Tax=Deinandra increscens subsp. villosa TaxID=3103831 RepID=A0AAP0D6E8_9ASTR
MNNQEAGTSSHAVYIQGINPSLISLRFTCNIYPSDYAFFSEKILPVDPTTTNLLNQVRKLNENGKFSAIYVVPNTLREVNPSSFTPRVVSIGPLHKGLANLKSVESKKPKDMKELLLIVGSLEEMSDTCMKKVRGSIKEIRRYYFGMDDHKFYNDDELVEMMVMDACFILLFIYKLPVTGNLFSDNKLRSRNIALDLVMLENQIPFFVLQDIYNLTIGKLQPESTLTSMLKVLLDHINPFEQPLIDENVGTETTHYHILGLLHKFYQRINFRLPIIEAVPIAHSAVELDKVGVKIRANKMLSWPMAIEFEYPPLSSHKPILKMPVVRIDNFFEVVFRNLIAYEQYSPVENYVTSYAMAMHMLAATPEDISKLGKSGVIFSHLGSNEKASDMISSICKNINLLDFYYTEAWTNIAQYYDSYWLRNLAVFKRTYIDTPWKAIALLAAIIVFFITVIQFFRQLVTPLL